MAVKLRLMRLGRRGQPFYRIIAVDSRKKRDGAYLEKIGYYNPLSSPAEVAVDDEKALKWLKRGAIPSDTVRSLLSRRGIMLAFDLQKKGAGEDEIRDKVARFRLEKEAKLGAREEAAQQARAEKAKVQKPEAEAAEAEITEPEEAAREVVEATEAVLEKPEAEETEVEKVETAEPEASLKDKKKAATKKKAEPKADVSQDTEKASEDSTSGEEDT